MSSNDGRRDPRKTGGGEVDEALEQPLHVLGEIPCDSFVLAPTLVVLDPKQLAIRVRHGEDELLADFEGCAEGLDSSLTSAIAIPFLITVVLISIVHTLRGTPEPLLTIGAVVMLGFPSFVSLARRARDGIEHAAETTDA